MEQKIFRIQNNESLREIDQLLSAGWRVVSVTAQHVSAANGYSSTVVGGDMFIVLEKYT